MNRVINLRKPYLMRNGKPAVVGRCDSSPTRGRQWLFFFLSIVFVYFASLYFPNRRRMNRALTSKAQKYL